MKEITKRRNTLAALLTAGLALTAGFLLRNIPEGALVCGAGSAVLLVLLAIQFRRLRDAKLLCDNRILTVPSAVISQPESGRTTELAETVVSTFGVLTGGRVYLWGCDGVRGTRLLAVGIDRGRISLTLGGANQSLRIDLPHGLADKQAVLEICRILEHETGVKAAVSGWNMAQE
ncbi:MAG: hypothetical protein AAGU74_14870 [Bacillota bacterium]